MKKSDAERAKTYRERKAKAEKGKTEIRGAMAHPENHKKWKDKIKKAEK